MLYRQVNMLVRESISFKRKRDPKKVLGVGRIALIENWFEKYVIPVSFATKNSKYTIREDFSIDVDGFFTTTWAENFPEFIRLNEVRGDFVFIDFEFNNITSLIGCPKTITGDFNCSYTKIKNFIGGPIEVYGNYTCSLIPTLKSFEGLSKHIGGNLYCNNKSGLTEKDIPKTSIIKGFTTIEYWSNW